MAALDFFFADRRPQAWNGWAEVVGRDLREPRFIGDMPHAWISSDYIRSALDLFVYERDADHALVLAAGLPMSWIDSATGVGVREVRTPVWPADLCPAASGGPDDPDAVAGRDAAWRLRAAMAGGCRTCPPASASTGAAGEWKGRELVIPAGARRVELR